MTHRFYVFPLVLLAGAFLVFGCDQSSQNPDFSSGDSYIINLASSANGGAEIDSVTVPDTVDYFVQAFTKEKDYTWTLNGEDLSSETRADQSYVWDRRNGEFISVVYSPDAPKTSTDEEITNHTITVDASSDDIQSDTVQLEAVYPEAIATQLGRLSEFSTLASLATSSGISGIIEGGGPLTILGPQTPVLNALEEVPTQATDGDEPITSSVRADLLKYHALDVSIASGDITDGQTEPTLLGNQTVTFAVSGETISVNGADITYPDVPLANDDENLHGVDGLLLPSTASVDFTDRTPSDSALARTGADTELAAGDSLTVDGSLFPDGGGFVVLHDSTQLDNGQTIGSIVGHSDFVDSGVQNEIRVELDEAVSDTTTIGAMAHEDTNGNEQYDFEVSNGADDTPFTLDGDVVIDYAIINIPQ